MIAGIARGRLIFFIVVIGPRHQRSKNKERLGNRNLDKRGRKQDVVNGTIGDVREIEIFCRQFFSGFTFGVGFGSCVRLCIGFICVGVSGSIGILA